jgi:hypothetical protein
MNIVNFDFFGPAGQTQSVPTLLPWGGATGGAHTAIFPDIGLTPSKGTNPAIARAENGLFPSAQSLLFSDSFALLGRESKNPRKWSIILLL